MFSKSWEYYAVLLGMVLYAASRDAEREALRMRLWKTLASALLAIGLSPDLATYFSTSETFITVGIMALGMILLDVSTALLKDRAFIKDLIRRRVGGAGDE